MTLKTRNRLFSKVCSSRTVLLLLIAGLGLTVFSNWTLISETSLAVPPAFPRSGKVIYVKKDGTGNGKSWEKALGDLQAALEIAKKNDQIWVAEGVYHPTYDGDRNISFALVESVALLGGFAGTETSSEERDAEKYPTVLSGEIGTADTIDDSYTVVYAENISRLTVVDGFIIRGGRADGLEAEISKNTCGAAWFNYNASPTIRNCRFENNTAREGGAIYNLAGDKGNSSPLIANCVFVGNQADLDGGCIFNNGDGGICKPRIENCKFEKNTATYGSGMMNRARHGMTFVQVRQCEFYKNKALVKGGVIYNHRDKTGICTTNVQDCIFEGNFTTVGSDMDQNSPIGPDIVGNE